MNKFALLAVVVAGVIAMWVGSGSVAMAQLYGEVGGDITATPEQLEECKQLGIPEFACTQHSILAKKRLTTAQQEGAYGSGTSMVAQTFGELGIYVAALGAIFGGISAAFFAMALRKPKIQKSA
ncbi:MAG: hypothetical protein RMJ59_02915 [Candidatus Nitrosocaldus sp.]|nr:hypothetical protein [Candidatus Nitrosocaldus sp.]MDW8275321.1 hypothetical protein [Candidatus Nitrosocaldus sp.]